MSELNDQIELERAKFEFDKTTRIAELQIKQTESARLADELEIKKREASRSRWTNPFIVAIIGAILVGSGNIGVSIYNGYAQRDLEKTTAQHQKELADRNNNYSIALETLREENSDVIEVLKLGHAEDIRSGLCLLLKFNLVKSPATTNGIQSYSGGCPTMPTATQTRPPSSSDWLTTQALVPGCGESGCYAPTTVCGSAPANTKPTGNTRNYTDSFGGAFGNWADKPTVTANQVCQVFIQHSHNVARTVSFQFEVVPVS
jgi:hypothetical protein